MEYLLNPDGTSSFTTISDLKDNFEESFAKKQLGARMTDIFVKSISGINGINDKDIFEDPFAKSLIDNSIAEIADKCYTNTELGGNTYMGGIRKTITEYVGMESDYREDLAYAIWKSNNKSDASKKIFELFSTENLDFMSKDIKKHYGMELETLFGSESEELVTEIGKVVGEAISEADEKNIIINQTSAVIQETRDEMNEELTGGNDEEDNDTETPTEEDPVGEYDDTEDTGEEPTEEEDTTTEESSSDDESSTDEQSVEDLEYDLQHRLESDIESGVVTIGNPENDIVNTDDIVNVSDHEENEIVNNEEPEVGEPELTVSDNTDDFVEAEDEYATEDYDDIYGMERFIGLDDEERANALKFFESKKSELIREYSKFWKNLSEKLDKKLNSEDSYKINKVFKSQEEFDETIKEKINSLQNSLKHKKGITGNSRSKFIIKLFNVKNISIIKYILILLTSMAVSPILGLVIFFFDKDHKKATKTIKDAYNESKAVTHTKIKIKGYTSNENFYYAIYMEVNVNLKRFYKSGGLESLETEYLHKLYGNENISKTIVPLSPSRLDALDIPSTKSLATIYAKSAEGLDSLKSVIGAKFDILKDIVDREHDEDLDKKFETYKTRAMEAFDDASLIVQGMNNINITPYGLIGTEDFVTTAIGSRAYKYLNNKLKIKYKDPKRSYEDFTDAIDAAFDISIIKDNMRRCKDNDTLIALSNNLQSREDLFWSNIVDLNGDEEKKEQIKNILQFGDLDLTSKALVDTSYLKSVQIALDTLKPTTGSEKSESEINDEIFDRAKTKIESFLGKDISIGQVEIIKAMIEGRDTSDFAPTTFEKFIIKLGTDKVLEKDGNDDFEVGQESATTIFNKAVVLTALDTFVSMVKPMDEHSTKEFNDYITKG